MPSLKPRNPDYQPSLSENFGQPPPYRTERTKDRNRILAIGAIILALVGVAAWGALRGKTESPGTDEPDKPLFQPDRKHARYGGVIAPDLSNASDQYKHGLEHAQDVVEP